MIQAGRHAFFEPTSVSFVPRGLERRKGFTRLSPKRQITLPLAVVEQAGMRIGEELAVEADDNGRVIVSRSNRETLGARRRRALDRAAGALPGVWPAGALDELRDEVGGAAGLSSSRNFVLPR